MTSPTLKVLVTAALVIALGRPIAALGPCTGDCNGDGEVTIEEILRMVNIALGQTSLSECHAGDGNCDGEIAVDDIIVAVNNALGDPQACVRTCDSGGGCGDGVVDSGEECDDGGICIGGAAAGMACVSDDECGPDQPGVCLFGPALGRACLQPEDCPGSTCVRCRKFGGEGCAANCTVETDVPFELTTGIGIEPRSNVSIQGASNPIQELPLHGSQVLTLGKERDGVIPFVVRASSVQFSPIPISTIACACVRGTEVKTCGGMLFDTQGRRARECTLRDDCADAGQPPCASVHGPGNSAAGVIGCQGLEPVDVMITHDCNAEPGGAPFDPVISLTGAGPAGSAVVQNSIQIGTQVGTCTPTFCTDADPPAARGTPTTFFSTTSVASAIIVNANDMRGSELGPESETGAVFSCAALSRPNPSVAGTCLAGVFTACAQPTLGDIVGTTLMCAR
jgi:hypothetical protein